MSGTAGWFEERGIDIAQVFDWEDTFGGLGAVLGKSAVHCYTMSLKVFAEECFDPTAVEAFAAEFAIVSYDSVTDFEPFDFGSDICNDAHCFVAWNEWELGDGKL